MMIGQDELINKINSYSFYDFPQTLLLEGEFGSGRHTLCKFIADKFNLDLRDISDKVNYDTVEQAILTSIPTLYIIDCLSLTYKNQNILLKFIEEPPKNSIIILITENSASIIDTIKNRCMYWKLAAYTKEHLKQFTSNIELLDLYNTPGQILKFSDEDIEKYIKLSNDIINFYKKANYSNLLSIDRKFDEKFNKEHLFNWSLFSKILYKTTFNKYMKAEISYDFFKETLHFYTQVRIKNFNNKYLFDSYLTRIKNEC